MHITFFENHIIIIALTLFFISYLIGSIPFGLILTRLWGYGDIRKVGSGNIGATNALRTGSKLLAFLVLFLDAFKSFFIIKVFKFFNYSKDLEILIFIILIGSIIGHCYPVWLKFKGGKGVATILGGLIGINLSIGILIGSIWLFVIFTFKKSSLSSLLSISCLPIVIFIFYGFYELIFSILLFVIICFRHKGNIKRLIKSEEPNVFEK